MEKRGVSEIIAAMLLIIISIALALSVYSFIQHENISDIQAKFNCINDVYTEILDACHEGNLLKIKFENRNDVTLGDFFLVTFYFTNLSELTIPTPYNTYIMPYETKTIIMPYYPDIKKIKVLPKIERESYVCNSISPEFDGIKECKNE